MTQTDDARGPERVALQALKPDSWPETVHVGKAVIRFRNGVESGNWYSKPKDDDKTLLFTRATQPDPRVVALEKALRDAGDYIDKGRPQMAQNIIRTAIAALDAGGKDE